MHAREQHFQEELARATARWQEKPTFGDCAATLKEKADWELCQAAESALGVVTAEPPTTPEVALTRLGPAALALARLTERLRYLSLQELAQRRVEGDAGAPVSAAPPPPTSGPVSSALRAAARPQHVHDAHAEQRAMQLSESPVSRQLEQAMRLEREVIRNLGAYLEYGPMPVRRASFETAKALSAQHPRWPALARLLNEAAVLETDADLKRDLQGLVASGSTQRRAQPAQSAGTK